MSTKTKTKAPVIAWNQDDPTFYEAGSGKKMPNDYAGLVDLNGFLFSTGLTVSGRRWWMNVEA